MSAAAKSAMTHSDDMSEEVSTQQDVDMYIKNRQPYKDLVHSMILSHDAGHGWRFGQDHIKDTYKSNYKIHFLHRQIEKEYAKTKALLPVYRRIAEIERVHVSRCRQPADRYVHQYNSTELEKRIVDLESDETFDSFQDDVREILEEYSRLGCTRSVLSFAPTVKLGKRSAGGQGQMLMGEASPVNDWKIETDNSENDTGKERLVERYIHVASMYAWMTAATSSAVRGTATAASRR